ncbi:MAG TPA: hypothetical protein VFU13_20130 [Steroidobacteraceae bacterium]|nr:hypothetical protein [Steroidobacteraceae bacterium]
MTSPTSKEAWQFLWDQRAALALALCAGAILWIAPHVVDHYPVPVSWSDLSTVNAFRTASLGLFMQAVLLLAGCVIAFVSANTFCTLVKLSSTRARHWDWHEYSLATLILLGAFGTWQWMHIPWRHPPGAPNEEIPIANGRLYRANVEHERRTYSALYFETAAQKVLMRNIVCADKPPSARLAAFRALDNYHVECTWVSGEPSHGNESREVVYIESGSSLGYLREGQVHRAELARDKPVLRSVEDTDGSSASQCRLEAGPAAVRCGERKHVLVSVGASTQWPVPQAWHIAHSQRAEITVARRRLACLTAEVDGALPGAGVSRLPALVLVLMDQPADEPLRVEFVYDSNASCERIDEGALSGMALYRWSDETARGTRQSHAALRFPRP